MNNIENKNIGMITSETTELMNKIYGAAKAQLDAIKSHDKILLHDLIDKVVATTGIKTTIVQGMISMFIEDCVRNHIGTMENGRNGGFYKDGKKPKSIDLRPRCETCQQVLPKNKRNVEIHSDINIEDISSSLTE